MGLPRSRSSGRPQQQQQQLSKNKLISPDKTIGSTPPNSPPNNFDEDFNTNVFSSNTKEVEERDGEDRLAPLRAVAPAAHPTYNTQGGITTASKMSGLETQNYSNRPAVHNNNSNIISPNSSPTKQQLNTSSNNQRGSTPLRVDKILCRAPSHESNISDLSASLSPIGPRGHLSSPPNNNSNKQQQTVSKYNGNIVTELLNECGVLDNVNDILNEAGFHGLDGSEVPPPPPPPQDGAAKEDSGNKEEKKYRYEKPAVWGVAPDDDDTYMDSPQAAKKGGLKPSVTQEDSVEYDNVELVLDESTLNPSSFDNQKGGKRPPTPTSGLKKFMGGSSSSRNTKSTNKDSGGGGGILKKLKKSNAPSTQISPSESKDGRSTPGISVIENKNDPRISHVYDVTEFENDNLAPHVSGEGGQGSGEKGGEGIKKKGSFGNLIKKNSRSKGSNKSDPFDGVYCQPVGGAELATKDRSGLSATPSGEVEINSAPVLKSENTDDKSKKQPKTPKRSFFKKNKSHNEVVQNMGHVNVNGEEQSKISSLAMGSPSRGRFSNKSIKSSLGDKLERLDESTATSNKKKKNKLIGMNLPPTPVGASNLTQEQLTQAKYWNATLDKLSNKIYYYHRVTKEVTWIKPLGYDEVNNATTTTPENIERSRTMPTSNVGGGNKGDINKEKENAVNTTAAAAVEKTPTTPSRKKIGLGSMLSKKNKSKVEDNKQISTTKSEAALAAVVESTKITNANTNAKQTKNNWRATIDASTNKTYYYNKKTKEVSWTKPDGFVDVVSGTKAEEKEVEETLAMASVAEKRKKSGWFKKKSTTEEEGGVDEDKKSNPTDKATTTTNTTAAVDETIKYWRATKDATTGKTYYFNKKTKLVQWTKPEGYDEMLKLKAMEDEKKKKEGVVAVEKSSSGKDDTKKEGEVGGIETLSTGMADINDDESEIEGFNDAEAIGGDAAAANKQPVLDEDAPFDEPEAPFDEPMAPPPSSPTRVTQSKQDPQENKSDADDDADEQEDLFDEQEDSYDSDHLPGQQPMYGRVKSLKSIDLGRKSTFTSHMTDTTRKATNTRSAPRSPRPIAREIFTDNKKSDITNEKEQVNASRRPESTSREKLKDGLQMPPTPTRTYGRNRSGGNRYSGKRAENLGDSSNDESTLESKQQHRRQEDDHDEYWSGDDVSALSGIGNESIESKRKRRDAANRKKREVSVFSCQ